MRELFDLKKTLVKQMKQVGKRLDEKIVEEWGFHYSQTDNSPMIDCLDYGTNDMTFEDFTEWMDTFKEERKNGDWKPNA